MRAEVFAVEDTSVQVCWDGVPAGPITVSAGAVSQVVDHRGGPGAVVLDGLPHSTTVDVSITSPHGRTLRAGRVTTLVPPPGRRLSRFATINDMHLGARSFGTWRRLWNDDPLDPHPQRCMRAALAEAIAWGAEAIVVKGDVTQRGRPNEWDEVGAILAATELPILAIEGNHDTKTGAVDGTAILAGHGISLATVRPSWLDLPGVRIVGVPTARWHLGDGRFEPRAVREAAALLSDAPPGAGCVVALHHYPQRLRFPTIYPTGIPGPPAHRALDTWAEANPATLVLAGHTHRHHRRHYRSLLLAEAGSTKDFPGSWAGYTVHEGGILQTTRRVMDPRVMAWTERGRWVLMGLWGVWAPGVRGHRCFAYVWPG